MACCGNGLGGSGPGTGPATITPARAHSIINGIHEALAKNKAGIHKCKQTKDIIKRHLAFLDASHDPAFGHIRYAVFQCSQPGKLLFAYSALHRMTPPDETSTAKHRLLLSFMFVQQGNNLLTHTLDPAKYQGNYNPLLSPPSGAAPSNGSVLQTVGTPCPGQCIPGALGQNRCPSGLAGSGLPGMGGCACSDDNGGDLAASLECNTQAGLDFC